MLRFTEEPPKHTQLSQPYTPDLQSPPSPQEEPKQNGSAEHCTSLSQYYFSKMIYYIYFMRMSISCRYIYIHEFFQAQHT